MRIFIYTGAVSTGKTTQLAASASRFAKTHKEALDVVASREIKEYDNEKYLFFDCFSIKEIKNIKRNTIDFLYLGCQELPDVNYLKKYFNTTDIIIRETKFPLCHYISNKEGMFYANFGGYYFKNKSKSELFKEINTPIKSKIVTIENKQEIKKLLDNNSEIPLNISEWGLDYAHLMSFRGKFNKMKGNEITVTDDEAFAIANFNSYKVKWIEDLFFLLFS